MAYHAFEDQYNEDAEFGSFEVFYRTANDATWTDDNGDQHDDGAGWYWWACFPGCLPDGDPCGPFETEQEAIDDAQGN